MPFSFGQSFVSGLQGGLGMAERRRAREEDARQRADALQALQDYRMQSLAHQARSLVQRAELASAAQRQQQGQFEARMQADRQRFLQTTEPAIQTGGGILGNLAAQFGPRQAVGTARQQRLENEARAALPGVFSALGINAPEGMPLSLADEVLGLERNRESLASAERRDAARNATLIRTAEIQQQGQQRPPALSILQAPIMQNLTDPQKMQVLTDQLAKLNTNPGQDPSGAVLLRRAQIEGGLAALRVRGVQLPGTVGTTGTGAGSAGGTGMKSAADVEQEVLSIMRSGGGGIPPSQVKSRVRAHLKMLRDSGQVTNEVANQVYLKHYAN